MGRNGTGVRAASESSIEIDFTYQGKRCRERIALKPTPANLKRAERHRAAILDAIEKGTFDYTTTFPNSKRAAQHALQPGDAMTVESYLSAWLDQQAHIIKASTLLDYRKTILYQIIPAFGALRLSDLKRPNIRDWCQKLTCSNKRIANILSPLRVALQDAMQDELIDTNPLFGWTWQRKEAPAREDDIDPFSAEEQAAILAALDGHGRNLIQFAFWTGLRTSELIALQWGDIDKRRGIIKIQRALTQAADEDETTKTRAGRREVKLLAPALAALEAQKPLTYLRPDNRIFLNPRTGEPWEGDQAIRKTLWTHALKRAGVSYRRPYQTRHTYASMMLTAGESPMWVAAQMGHADWGMIRRTYGRWIPDAAPEAGQKAVALFAAEKPGIDPGSKTKSTA